MMDLSLVPYTNNSECGKYKECMRNHAAAMGGHAYDGCGEFMPVSSSDLTCAACGCHRNFHRRTTDPLLLPAPYTWDPHHRSKLQGPPYQPYITHHHQAPLPLPYHAVPERSRAGSETPPRMEIPDASGSAGTGSGGRKRHRTKFTPEQKEKMQAFAEKLGWRMQRHDDGEMDRFCQEIGVKRHVLKVWMHNHKHHLAPNSPPVVAQAGVHAGVDQLTAAAAAVDQSSLSPTPSPSPSPSPTRV